MKNITPILTLDMMAMKFRRLNSLGKIIFLLGGAISLILLLINIELVLILFLFVVCVISRLPLRILNWSGFLDMNLILVIYSTMSYGIPAGLFIATASIISRVLSGEIDNNILYDAAMSYIIVFIATLSSLTYFIPFTTVSAVIYLIFFNIYNYFTGGNVLDVAWSFTYFIWILFFIYKLLPLIKPIFFVFIN